MLATGAKHLNATTAKQLDAKHLDAKAGGWCRGGSRDVEGWGIAFIEKTNKKQVLSSVN